MGVKLSWNQSWTTALGTPIVEADYRRFVLSIDGGDNVDMNLPFKANGNYSYTIDTNVTPLALGNHIAGIRLILKNGERSIWVKVPFTISSAAPQPPANLTAEIV